MAKSPYFRNSSENEQRLYENIITESIYIMGEDILYLPRTIVNFDTLFGEDILSKYTESFLLEAYMDNQNSGFGNQANIFGKFGIEVKDEAIYTISKTKFEQVVLDNNLSSLTRPLEGDLIYSIVSRELFQIKFVEEENPYRQFGKIQTYKLSCEAYKYSNQRINTDIVEREANGFSTALTITLDAGVGDFIIGEAANNGTVNGKVVDWNIVTRELKLIDMNGAVNEILPIISGSTVWSIAKFKTTDDTNILMDINDLLEKKADTIVDQSEVNALGKIVTSNFMNNF
jgi:hypothetical protein